MANKRNNSNGSNNTGFNNTKSGNAKSGSPKSGNTKSGNGRSNHAKSNNSGSGNGSGKPGRSGKQNRANDLPVQSKAKESYEEPAFPVTEEEADDIRVTVNLDDGTREECMILTIMTVGGQDYIALLPMDENDQPNEEGRVYLYRYFEDENQLPYMENIEDDDEYEAVFDAFDEWQDDQLFDSMD